MNNILFIDADKAALERYSSLVRDFSRLPATFFSADAIPTAKRQIQNHAIDVVYIRESTTAYDAVEFMANYSQQNALKPIFLLTDARNNDLETKALAAGAVDILLVGHLSPDILERTSRFSIERYKSRIELLESESRFRGIFNVSPQFMLLVDQKGDIVNINNTALALMELPSKSHIINRQLSRLPIWRSAQNFEFIVSDAFASTIAGLECDFSIPLISRTGKHFQMKFSFKPFFDHKMVPSILVEGTDVTILKTKNDELKRKVADRTKHLEESRRIAEEASLKLLESNHHRSRFLANMSHELRTPLNSILGFSDLLKGAHFGALNEKQTSYVNQIEKSGNHLLSLINDLLDLTKIDSGASKLNVQKINPLEVINSCVEMIEVQAVKKNLEIVNEVNPEIQELPADPQRFRQILINLLTNAVKYTENGTIKITGRILENGDVLFTVKDSGIGISKDDQQRVFNEFYQADRVRDERLGGTGIGLALTKRLVELHGGHVGLNSEEGKGSEFWFKLPFNTPNERSSSDIIKVSSIITQTSKNAILAVNDSQSLAVMIELLQLCDYRSVLASTKKELLELIQVQKARVVILGLELNMQDTELLLQDLKATKNLSKAALFGIIPNTKSPLKSLFERYGASVFLRRPLYASNFLGMIQSLDDQSSETRL
ncbi:MAG: ATP-binding protein [Sumerlaeia bacterium]